MKILVCEDDVVAFKIIQVSVENLNITITHAKDGIEAMKILKRQNDFDLIITDIHMPYHNGDEILNLVRQEQKKSTPIMMISSDTEEEVVRLALKSGVNEFVNKPIDADKIRKKIKRLLKL